MWITTLVIEDRELLSQMTDVDREEMADEKDRLKELDGNGRAVETNSPEALAEGSTSTIIRHWNSQSYAQEYCNMVSAKSSGFECAVSEA